MNRIHNPGNDEFHGEINKISQENDIVKSFAKGERDNQTKLYNKTTVIHKLDVYLSKMLEENHTDNHSFLLIDIDNLEQLNFKYGHIYGDIVLETFAKCLLDFFRQEDIIGRISGDGFVVFPKRPVNREEIPQIAEAVLNLAKNGMHALKKDGQITVSIGISNFPDDGSTYEELFQKADLALYEAKSGGKGKYVIYSPDNTDVSCQGEIKQNPDKPVKKPTYEEFPDTDRRLLNYIFNILSEDNTAEASMNKIFTEIGKFYDLSRITIFEVDPSGQNTKISYEWLNENVPSAKIDKTSTVKEQYKDLFKTKNIFYFEDVTKLDTSTELLELYNNLGIKAIVQCAIYDSGQFIGTVNFEDCNQSRIWQKSVLDTLLIITKVIGNYVLQRRSKDELNREIFFTQAMLNNQKLSNYAIDADTYELLYVSEYTESLFPGVKLGDICYKAIFGRDNPCDACPINGLNGANKRYSVEYYNEKLDAWLSTTASTVEMLDGKKMYLLCSSDVTSFIDRVISKDPLTGLLTLPKFEAEAMKLIASRNDLNYAIVYSDFDKFKYINDEWGYSLGNEILKFFAANISKFLEPGELFCRISGDSFVNLFIYRDKSEFLERIKFIFYTINQAYRARFPKVNPIIISGLYFMTKDDGVLSIAMDKANTARKRLKGFHKSTLSIYDENLHKTLTKEKIIENQMYDALKNHEFIVYMQPKIDLNSLNIVGAEALVRWKNQNGELMNPAEFIPVFEKNGFILEMDFYVYEEAFKMLRNWLDMGKKEIIISINVSRLHIDDDNFIQKLEKLLEKYRIPSRLIEIEITESIFMNELDRLQRFISTLRSKGFLISIDDFGSGFSSLNLLKTLPIDIIKLDKDFFTYNVMDEKDKIIIANIINLAKGLGLKVISEGVETMDQALFLKENNCDMVQGYFFFKPMPMEELGKLIESN